MKDQIILTKNIYRNRIPDPFICTVCVSEIRGKNLKIYEKSKPEIYAGAS